MILTDFCMLYVIFSVITGHLESISVSLIMKDQVKETDAIGNELWEHIH